MKYANTIVQSGVEVVLIVLPLTTVSAFDPENPHPFTYGVPDDVEVGWIKQADGTFVAPPPTPVVRVVPQVVSVFQGRAALMQAGYLDDVEQYMETADPFEKLAWDTVTEMRRTSPLTIKLAVLLGLTDEQVDDLFVFAFTIRA